MKKILLSLVFFPLIISNTSQVETTVKTEATGENASTHTEITNIINGEETHVESDQPGEIKVEVKDGEVKVESSSEVQPTIFVSEPSQEETKEERKEVFGQVEAIKERLFSLIEVLFSRLRESLSFFHT